MSHSARGSVLFVGGRRFGPGHSGGFGACPGSLLGAVVDMCCVFSTRWGQLVFGRRVCCGLAFVWCVYVAGRVVGVRGVCFTGRKLLVNIVSRPFRLSDRAFFGGRFGSGLFTGCGGGITGDFNKCRGGRCLSAPVCGPFRCGLFKGCGLTILSLVSNCTFNGHSFRVKRNCHSGIGRPAGCQCRILANVKYGVSSAGCVTQGTRRAFLHASSHCPFVNVAQLALGGKFLVNAKVRLPRTVHL